MDRVQYLRIPLKQIQAATNNFDDKNNYIAQGGFGRVYKGELSSPDGPPIDVAVKRLNRQFGQGDDQFHVEIAMLSECKHPNLVSLVGFCDEGDERILVYVHESNRSLDLYVRKPDLSWVQRLHISIGAARALHYLHEEVGSTHRVLHRDMKSANILLNEGWEAKVSDFGLARIAPANMPITIVPTSPCGTFDYVDPAYIESRILTKESDVYSFGVVLFEILCGWLAFQNRDGLFLVPQAKHHYEHNTLDEIIIPDLWKQMKQNSLDTFSNIAYQCLKSNRCDRPRMDKVLKELEKALQQQISPKTAKIAQVGTTGTKFINKALARQGDLKQSDFGLQKVQHLKIPLEKIREATNNFDQKRFIAKGGFGSVYKGELSWSHKVTHVVVKRLDPDFDEGNHEFLMEITMLSRYKHKNLVSLVGFCNEGKEKVLVYMHESKGSLDQYIRDPYLSWIQRLQICIGAANGLDYLHDGAGPQHRILHRDIKSANILLNDNWIAKVSDFGLSKIGPSNLQHTFLVTNVCGTFGYLDPAYYRSGVLTKESDVYSFGVLLFEILCGRLAAEHGKMFLGPLAETLYEENKLDEIINPTLRKQMKLNSLNTFSAIAYQCIKSNRSERPTMAQVIEQLEKAFALQVSLQTAIIARVGTWGTKSAGGPENRWDFLIEKDHKLKMITVDHGDLIYSLMFTTESKGVLYTSNKAGGWNGGDIVSEVVFDDDEEIIDINGTVGVSKGEYAGYTIVSSLSFVTNKMIHGPFGEETNASFSIPCEKGNFGGFYGLAGYYIDAIGVYMRANSEEITRVGIWGTKSAGGPQNQWSFQLERNHHLKKITIDHGDLIYSLMFTTEYKGLEQTTDKAGGNGGDIVSEVTFTWDEEINAINGTIGVSKGTYAGYTIISSLSFVTNKKTHGPYGRVKGTPFVVPWDKGSFAGFYGLAGYYIEGIGVYLKATM